MSNVLVTFPTSPAHPYLHKGVVFASWRLLRDRRHDLTPIIPTHAPFENNLHHCVNEFMNGDYRFWLSIDADNPPMKNPLDLIDLDLDIIGFPTPVWHCAGNGNHERPVYWNAYDYVPEKDAYREHEPKEGLQAVDAIGTGCFLIARRVFQNVLMRRGAFARQCNSDGTVNKGNDISFCEAARVQGFQVWTHYDYPCQHFVSLELNEVVKGFRCLYEE